VPSMHCVNAHSLTTSSDLMVIKCMLYLCKQSCRCAIRTLVADIFHRSVTQHHAIVQPVGRAHRAAARGASCRLCKSVAYASCTGD
jgi:hypothetical protein